MITKRQKQIIKLLSENGYMEVTDLASLLNVSVATIRRDLHILEDAGVCQRKHGGCMLNNKGFLFEIPYEEKERNFIEEKKAIAEIAKRYVNNGDVVILDTGSTVFQLAVQLQEWQKNLTIVTSDIKTALLLAKNSNIHLYVPGGSVLPGVYSIIGTKAVEWYEDLHANTLFLGVDAIHNDGKIMNCNDTEVYAKRAKINASDKVIMLATSDKFLRKGFMKVCDMDNIDILITDSKIEQSTLDWLRRYDVEVIVADPDRMLMT